MADKTQMDGEVYHPSNEVVEQARLKDWDALAEKAHKDLQGFWAEEADELEWYKKWDKVLDYDFNKPYIKWFTGGKLNASYNCLDRYINTPVRNKAAIIWEADDGS